MCQKGLIRCEALPCFFWHENLHILVELHQDDFHCTARVGNLMWLKNELKDEIRLKFSEIVYSGMLYSHLKANRLVTSQGTLIVASSRYISDIPEAMGMQKCSEPRRRSPRCVAVILRQMDRCWKPTSTESFKEWLVLLDFCELSVQILDLW